MEICLYFKFFYQIFLTPSWAFIIKIYLAILQNNCPINDEYFSENVNTLKHCFILITNANENWINDLFYSEFWFWWNVLKWNKPVTVVIISGRFQILILPLQSITKYISSFSGKNVVTKETNQLWEASVSKSMLTSIFTNTLYMNGCIPLLEYRGKFHL